MHTHIFLSTTCKEQITNQLASSLCVVVPYLQFSQLVTFYIYLHGRKQEKGVFLHALNLSELHAPSPPCTHTF